MPKLIKPDDKLAQLQAALEAESDKDRIALLKEQINNRQIEIMREGGYTNVGFGSYGYVLPGAGQAVGAEVLEPTGIPGIYSKSVITADTSTDPYGRRSVDMDGNKKTFYDASGNPISPDKIANTTAGQSFARAGWDIGFGPGVLPEGTPDASDINSPGNQIFSNATPNGFKPLTADDVEKKARKAAQDEFKAALTEMGLADLADVVDKMIKQDYTAAQIRLELPKTKEYTERFPGMKALRDAGRAINEATYIANERAYTQTLRAYGLDTAVLGNRAALGSYIANEVSPREFEERVDIAATRVKDNPDVMDTFKVFYPEIDQGGVIAYMLNPKAGLDIIKRQIRTAEIGAAATNAGFAQEVISMSEAANLIPAVGDTTFNQIALEFQRAKQLAQSQRRLADIERQQYSDLEAIGAVVGDNLQNIMASERRAAREAARFSASSGVTGASLRTADMNI